VEGRVGGGGRGVGWNGEGGGGGYEFLQHIESCARVTSPLICKRDLDFAKET